MNTVTVVIGLCLQLCFRCEAINSDVPIYLAQPNGPAQPTRQYQPLQSSETPQHGVRVQPGDPPEGWVPPPRPKPTDPPKPDPPKPDPPKPLTLLVSPPQPGNSMQTNGPSPLPGTSPLPGGSPEPGKPPQTAGPVQPGETPQPTTQPKPDVAQPGGLASQTLDPNVFKQQALEMGNKLTDLLKQEITFLSKISNIPISELDRITVPNLMNSQPYPSLATQAAPGNQITVNTYASPCLPCQNIPPQGQAVGSPTTSFAQGMVNANLGIQGGVLQPPLIQTGLTNPSLMAKPPMQPPQPINIPTGTTPLQPSYQQNIQTPLPGVMNAQPTNLQIVSPPPLPESVSAQPTLPLNSPPASNPINANNQYQVGSPPVQPSPATTNPVPQPPHMAAPGSTAPISYPPQNPNVPGSPSPVGQGQASPLYNYPVGQQPPQSYYPPQPGSSTTGTNFNYGNPANTNPGYQQIQNNPQLPNTIQTGPFPASTSQAGQAPGGPVQPQGFSAPPNVQQGPFPASTSQAGQAPGGPVQPQGFLTPPNVQQGPFPASTSQAGQAPGGPVQPQGFSAPPNVQQGPSPALTSQVGQVPGGSFQTSGFSPQPNFAQLGQFPPRMPQAGQVPGGPVQSSVFPPQPNVQPFAARYSPSATATRNT